MAGRDHRTYGRKKASTQMSQFDRLISEASNKSSHHPVAAKTAGHVGKWGITSFTSIRSINGAVGKEDTLKRGSSSEECDPFGFEPDIKNEPKSNCPTVKRRKFFKSRESGALNTTTNESSSSIAPLSDTLLNIAHNKVSSKPLNEVSVNQKSSKDSSVKPSGGGGGIKLKIFKSRNTGTDLHSPSIYSSSIQLPSDDSSNSSLSSNGTTGEKSDSNHSNGNISSVVLPTKSLINEEVAKKLVCDYTKPSICSSSDSSIDIGKCSENKSCNVVAPDPIQNDSSLFSVSNIMKDSSPLLNLKDSNPEITNSPLFSPKDSSAETNISYTGSAKIVNESSTNEVGVALFSTDFDEDEIVDRTSIDYTGISSEPASVNCAEPDNDRTTRETVNNNTNEESKNLVNKDPDCYTSTRNSDFSDLTLSRANTVVLSDIEASGSNSVCSVPKSLSEPDATSLFKKRSIFKSRLKDDEPKKRATYTHKWHGHEEKEKKELISSLGKQVDDPFGFDGSLTKVITKSLPSYKSGFNFDDEESFGTSIKCPKQAKKYYTVIQNVKKTHELQESGEFQEFNDDVDYFLDALRSSNKVATRCLASLNLAQKSMVPAFRMHLRAHAPVTKFFKALLDAPNHPHLASCAAMVMFALSQDRLNMDLDKESLELMLNLLDTDSTPMDDMVSSMDGAEHISKIKNLCKELQLHGHAKHLKLDQINAANLAMETLLSLTSKRAGEWFKEELRQLGGVDHLVRTVLSNTNHIKADMISWTSGHIDKLTRMDRCLKVLENITHQNISNQEYLLHIDKGNFSKILMRLFWICHQQITLNPENTSSKHDLPVYKTLVTTLTTTMKVLINLTHGSKNEALGSKILGNDDEIYTLTLNCLLKMPQYLSHNSKFEIQVLSCCLLLNLVEKSDRNREKLMLIDSPINENCEDNDLFQVSTTKVPVSSMCSLVTLFYSSEESAREQEAHTDNIIEKDLDQSSKEEEKKDEDIEETVARLLQKAGRHMEDTLIAAYTALLAGYCLLDNKEFEVKIRSMQPERHFKTMVIVLRKFLHFMNLTATTSLLRSLKPTEKVVNYMEDLDKEPQKEKKQDMSETCFDDAFGF